MHKLYAIVAAGLLAMAAGCRSTDSTTFALWEDIDDAKSYLNSYKHVMLICVYEDHWEDRGPNRTSLHHFMGTVVRAYKGDWSVSERVAFVHAVDAPALKTSNEIAGYLMFVLTNEHTDAEIALDTGEFLTYDPELGRVVEAVFPRRRSR
jgi:hypothetical protein